ncbi:hypothetical protein [Kitasatospora sp. NPDC090091]|uniref:hypothetical protein n=1 Tax=Kitasatospora sp. NPDC090091 TaxID=3364081 RepID=UPI003821D184
MTDMTRQAQLPGFTGEASLEPALGSYGVGGSTSGRAAPMAVVPQALYPWGPKGCIPNCVCITGEDCPCCGSMPPEQVKIRTGKRS